MRTKTHHFQTTPPALLTALLAIVAGFAGVWLLDPAPTIRPSRPAATVKLRILSGDHSSESLERAVAELLRPETLAVALGDARVTVVEQAHTAIGEVVEKVRRSLRVDIGSLGAGGMQEVKIRWIGDPQDPTAPRLVNVLAHQFAPTVVNLQLTPYRMAHDTALADVRTAESAANETAQQFDADLAMLETRVPASSSPVVADVSADGTSRVPGTSASQETRLLRQRLIDLESRRQALLERLTPEHPEMKTLDEKIEQLRSTLSVQRELPHERIARTTVASVPPAQDTAAIATRTANLRQTRQALLAAQAKFKAAQAREQSCLQTLVDASANLAAEIEPAVPNPAVDAAAVKWKRFLLASVTALLCGALVIAVWPQPRTLASADEVRTVTHLPVVILECASMN
jgi:hypothetical protein